MCSSDATKKCGCGADFCNRHFSMHSHPSGSGKGAGIEWIFVQTVDLEHSQKTSQMKIQNMFVQD